LDIIILPPRLLNNKSGTHFENTALALFEDELIEKCKKLVGLLMSLPAFL